MRTTRKVHIIMKYFALLKFMEKEPGLFFSLLLGAISSAINAVLLSLIIAGIATLFDKDFKEFFQGSFYVIFWINIVLMFISIIFL